MPLDADVVNDVNIEYSYPASRVTVVVEIVGVKSPATCEKVTSPAPED